MRGRRKMKILVWKMLENKKRGKLNEWEGEELVKNWCERSWWMKGKAGKIELLSEERKSKNLVWMKLENEKKKKKKRGGN